MTSHLPVGNIQFGGIYLGQLPRESGAPLQTVLSRAPTRPRSHSMRVFFLGAFNVLWLPLYWRMADKVNIGAGWSERLSEAVWLGVSLAW